MEIYLLRRVIGSPVYERLDEVDIKDVYVIGVVLEADPQREPSVFLIGSKEVGRRTRRDQRPGGFGNILATGGRAQVEHVTVLVVGIDVGLSSHSQRKNGEKNRTTHFVEEHLDISS